MDERETCSDVSLSRTPTTEMRGVGVYCYVVLWACVPMRICINCRFVYGIVAFSLPVLFPYNVMYCSVSCVLYPSAVISLCLPQYISPWLPYIRHAGDLVRRLLLFSLSSACLGCVYSLILGFKVLFVVWMTFVRFELIGLKGV